MSRNLFLALVAIGTAGLLCLAMALVSLQLAKGQSGPFPGTTIGGYLPHPTEHYSAWLSREGERRGAQAVQIVAGQASFERSLDELGVTVDVAAMLRQAERQRDAGGLLSQLGRYVSARLGRQDLVWITLFDPERARTTLLTLAPQVERSPIDASVDLQKRTRVKAQRGLRLDVEGTVSWLEHHRELELSTVEAVLVETAPRVTDDQASPIDIGQVLGAFETSFRGHAGPRAVNIRVAAKSLNGYVIEPGAVTSFNDVVGPRVFERGFREAPVIVDDEVEPGVGGGVCQVATTVHAAAVLAGFDVVQRRSHSRPSAYAPMGLDATVIDGKVDLKFRNPYAVPLLISTTFPDPFRLRVEIVGMRPSSQFSHSYAVEKRHDYYRRVVTKSNLAQGSFERKQKGNFGYDVISTITEKPATGPVKRRSYRSKYWPVPEVYWVGPNTDFQTLPPLPEGVTGVQLDGATVSGKIPSDVEARAADSQSELDLDSP